jgi:hypothetical protein
LNPLSPAAAKLLPTGRIVIHVIAATSCWAQSCRPRRLYSVISLVMVIPLTPLTLFLSRATCSTLAQVVVFASVQSSFRLTSIAPPDRYPPHGWHLRKFGLPQAALIILSCKQSAPMLELVSFISGVGKVMNFAPRREDKGA